MKIANLMRAHKGPKLSWEYTSEMSKCNTGNIHFCITSQQTFRSAKLEQNRNMVRYTSTTQSNPRLNFAAIIRISPHLITAETENFHTDYVMGGEKRVGQCYICSSHSYNPNLIFDPTGPHQIGNYTS